MSLRPAVALGCLCLAAMSPAPNRAGQQRIDSPERPVVWRCATPASPGGTAPRTSPEVGSNTVIITTTVKVNFHVITDDGGGGNVSDSSLDQQISALNQAFNQHGFWFVRNATDRTASSYCFTMSMGSFVEGHCKQMFQKQHANNPEGVLNFYVLDARDQNGLVTSGWAWYPWDAAGSRSRDSVTVHYTAMPGFAGGLEMNWTGVHETGHWLGLYHTFENGCNGEGDYVSDTPYEVWDGGVRSCFTQDTCPQPGVDPVNNFMNVTEDFCRTEFTQGQGVRMHDMEAIYRPALNRPYLTARGVAFGGWVRASLSWSGVLVPAVDIYRDGELIVSGTDNDGQHNDVAPGYAVYTVCSAGHVPGDVRCSNDASSYSPFP